MPKPGSAEALQVAKFPYREIIGTLLWISNGTRPDIVFAVITLAKFTSNPGLGHWRAALRVLGFLNTTKHHCIVTHNNTLMRTSRLVGTCEDGSRSHLTYNVMLMQVMQRMLIHGGVQLGTSSSSQEDLYHGKAVCKLPTAEQLADGMTKALPSSLFQSICLDHYLHRFDFEPQM